MTMDARTCALLMPAVLLACVTTARAQVVNIDGPPAPVAPGVVSRDSAGRATVRAIKLPSPLQVDGRLDEEVYQLNPAVSDFIQQVPREGAPATERTEAWVMFDSSATRCRPGTLRCGTGPLS